jgi:hypothetical protein
MADRFDLLVPRGCLARVARLIRAFHDAVTGFLRQRTRAGRWIPAEGEADIPAHHDLAPWNLVMARGGLHDWDLAAPWDGLAIAYAMHGFAPLSANHGSATMRHPGAGPRRRLRPGRAQRRSWCPCRPPPGAMRLPRPQASAGTQPWTGLWETGHGQAWQADTDYIEVHEAIWAAALLG